MLLELFQAVTGIFVVVYDGQHALRFTLGRAGMVVGPGVHFKFPIIQVFKVRDTKHTTLDLQPQVIQLEDDLVYEVDCKVVYQIVNLRKAIIEIDDLVAGLQNRVVMVVQSVLRDQRRTTIRDTEALVARIKAELHPIEEQWGVRILQFGFSNLSPSPATLEITQLELLAREKLRLYRELREQGVGEEAAVGLISGAVVSLDGRDRDRENDRTGKPSGDPRPDPRQVEAIGKSLEALEQERTKRRKAEDRSQGLFDIDDPKKGLPKEPE